MSGQIPEGEKKRRTRILRLLAEEKRRAFGTRFIGERLTVLVEGRTDKVTGYPLGFSDNYIPVAIRGGAIANQIIRVVPKYYRNGRLVAEVDPG
jgi:tRNA A37 methylthiotransferase MiaB